MKKTFLFASLAVLLFSCKKEDDEVSSTIEYTNYNNRAVTETTDLVLDLNKDGANDYVVTTQPVSDGTSTRLVFKVAKYQGTANRILLQEDEGAPKMMEKNETITKEALPDYEWTPLHLANLVEHVTPAQPAAPYWQGTWKEKQNKYLPVQLLKDNKTYNGWIQISFSAANTPQIIVHDAAVSKEADVSIKAGQK
jgi:hypothetical protein